MFLIVDGNNMAYRAMHTMSLSHNGVDVGIMYGMLRMLYAAVQQFNPSSVAVCFDGGTPAYRRLLLPSYKAHRMRSEDIDWDNAFWQMMIMRQVALPYHGIQTLWGRNVEADDLMAAAARLSTEPVILLTTDDDLLQCVGDKAKLFNPSKKKLYTIDNFEEELGVPPYTWLFYKALIGDSSDGVPGIKGIGPKTAQRIIATCEQAGDMDFTDIADVHSIALRTPKITSRQLASIESISNAEWRAAIDVMDLSHDHVGARSAIARAPTWRPPSKTLMKQFLYKYKFLSIMDQHYYGTWMYMTMPPISWDGVRAPVVNIRRSATS